MTICLNKLSSYLKLENDRLFGDSQGILYIVNDQNEKSNKRQILDGPIEILTLFKGVLIVAGGSQRTPIVYARKQEIKDFSKY